jgi:hypothetical protein
MTTCKLQLVTTPLDLPRKIRNKKIFQQMARKSAVSSEPVKFAELRENGISIENILWSEALASYSHLDKNSVLLIILLYFLKLMATMYIQHNVMKCNEM